MGAYDGRSSSRIGSIYGNYNGSKAHNILALKLDPHSNPLMW